LNYAVYLADTNKTCTALTWVSIVVQFRFSKLLNVRLLFLTGESKNLAKLLEVLSDG